MIGKTLVLIALVAAVNCEWWDASSNADTCKEQEGFDPKNPHPKMGCFMGCLGKAEKFINDNGEIDIENYNKWIDLVATKSSLADDMVTKWRATGISCATVAKGKKTNCDIGNSIGDCMKKEGAFKKEN